MPARIGTSKVSKGDAGVGALPEVIVTLHSEAVAARSEGGASGVVRLWDPATRQQVALLRLRKGTSFSTMAFSADGTTLVAANGAALQTWRAPSWAEIEAAEKKTESKTP